MTTLTNDNDDENVAEVAVQIELDNIVLHAHLLYRLDQVRERPPEDKGVQHHEDNVGNEYRVLAVQQFRFQHSNVPLNESGNEIGKADPEDLFHGGSQPVLDDSVPGGKGGVRSRDSVSNGKALPDADNH